MKASYLITFRDSDGTRLLLLEAVIARLAEMPQLDVIVVEQDRSPALGDIAAVNLETVFVYNDGPFNKSWGLNIAAHRARHDLLVIGDADMMMSSTALDRALTVCSQQFDAVSPYAHLVDMTQAETQAFLEGDLDLESIRREHLHDRQPQGEHICFCGGICVFRRDIYFALGGMDERFLGWGGEDDAMSINLGRYTDRLAVQKDTVAYHLWHPRPTQRYQHPHYQQNLTMAGEWRVCDQAKLEQRRAKHRETMGDPERYRPSH